MKQGIEEKLLSLLSKTRNSLLQTTDRQLTINDTASNERKLEYRHCSIDTHKAQSYFAPLQKSITYLRRGPIATLFAMPSYIARPIVIARSTKLYKSRWPQHINPRVPAQSGKERDTRSSFLYLSRPPPWWTLAAATLTSFLGPTLSSRAIRSARYHFIVYIPARDMRPAAVYQGATSRASRAFILFSLAYRGGANRAFHSVIYFSQLGLFGRIYWCGRLVAA